MTSIGLVRRPDHAQRLFGQVALRARERDALVGERVQIDAHLLNRHAPFLPGAEHLFDQVQQPVAVLQHHVVELVPLRFVYGGPARLQRFQVQPNRGDRRLQLVRHRVHERVVLLVEPDFADEKGGVEDEAGDDGGEHEAAEQQRDDLAKGEHDPADVERHGQRHQADAEGDEERDDALAAGGDGHSG